LKVKIEMINTPVAPYSRNPVGVIKKYV